LSQFVGVNLLLLSLELLQPVVVVIVVVVIRFSLSLSIFWMSYICAGHGCLLLLLFVVVAADFVAAVFCLLTAAEYSKVSLGDASVSVSNQSV